jgi:hypothetical protein
LDDPFKAVLSYIRTELSAPLGRAIATSFTVLACVAIAIQVFEGYGWHYVFVDAWFLGSATLALLICLFVAWKNRWVLNRASKFVAVPIMTVLAIVGFWATRERAQFVYNPIGLFEQRTWHRSNIGKRNEQWTWRLSAASDTPLKFDVRVDSLCDKVDIIQFYPIASGDTSPSSSEIGFQLTKTRMWEVSEFRQPSVIDYVLVLNNHDVDANRCVTRELRM